MVAKIIKKRFNNLRISTVYPGCIEEECVPLLEKYSGLMFNKDFFVDIAPKESILVIKNIPCQI